MTHLTIVAPSYPTSDFAHKHTFIRALVKAFVIEKVRCSVISPQSIWQWMGAGRLPMLTTETVQDQRTIQILRPCYISFGKRKIAKSVNTGKMTHISFLGACMRAQKRLIGDVDAYYGHFLYSSGASALRLAKAVHKPGFVAVGESDFWSIEAFGQKQLQKDYIDAAGIIAVSTKIKKDLHNMLGLADEKVRVFPNAVDPCVFYPRDRALVRKKLGLPSERLIVAFTGHFDERKGPHRLLAATRHLSDLGFILMGDGSLSFSDSRVLFKGKVRHEDMPDYLSAADMFVLPTLAEGCCNAIIEAMACELPIISSAGPFNDDILDENMSFRVDPTKLDDIGKAVEHLCTDDRLRCDMGRKAFEKSLQFQLPVRARAILEWIRSKSRKKASAAVQ